MASKSHHVHSVTTARKSRSEDQRSRYIQYTVAMSIRFACFIAAFFVHGPLMWVAIAGAVVLPYVAVVLANATNYAVGSIDPAEPPEPGHLAVNPADRPELGPGKDHSATDAPEATNRDEDHDSRLR